ncbi:MAG TPA: copper chaperone PCu(A)C [Acidimicrobiia bacterium]|nr:copper chaperone PCu(A)C [Acidimicrobiia bacterium]
MRKSLLLAALIVAVAACGGGESTGIEVTDVRVGQPTGPNAALYFTASSDVPDLLIGAETDAAIDVEIHETTMGDDGTMGMQPVESLRVGEGEDLVLEPGGFHLMLIDVERLDVGDEIEVTLIWENEGESTVTATVVEPEDAMGHEGDDS